MSSFRGSLGKTSNACRVPGSVEPPPDPARDSAEQTAGDTDAELTRFGAVRRPRTASFAGGSPPGKSHVTDE